MSTFYRGRDKWKEETNGGGGGAGIHNWGRLQKKQCYLFPQSSDINLCYLLSTFLHSKPKITSLDKLYKSKGAGSEVSGRSVKRVHSKQGWNSELAAPK